MLIHSLGPCAVISWRIVIEPVKKALEEIFKEAADAWFLIVKVYDTIDSNKTDEDSYSR